MKNKTSLLEKISRNRVVQHTLFWLFSFGVLINIFSLGEDLIKTDFIYTFLFHIPLVLSVYINLRILIPFFLNKKKYIFYVVGVLILVFLTAWSIELVFREKIVDFIFPGYFFISNYDIPNYAIFASIYLVVSTLLKMSKGWFELIEAQRQLSQLKEENLTTELQALKSQINPHFLFNSLNSVYSLSLDNDEITPKVILKLSELLRFMLYEASEEKVSLEKEIHHLKNYVEIQKLRVSDIAEIKFEAKGDFKDFQITPLLLLPLVENGFKHGIKGDVENAYIHVFSSIKKDEFIFSVKNNKGIVDEIEGDKYKGIGLKNVKRRLALLYPHSHNLEIIDDEKSFLVTLKLQVR